MALISLSILIMISQSLIVFLTISSSLSIPVDDDNLVYDGDDDQFIDNTIDDSDTIDLSHLGGEAFGNPSEESGE